VERTSSVATGIDWPAVNKVSFQASRGNVATESNEATVYSRRDLDFVIKVLKDPSALESYAHVVSRLIGLVPETAINDDVNIRVNNRPVSLGRCVIQQRISPIEFAILDGWDSEEQVISLMTNKAKLDENFFARRLYVPDSSLLLNRCQGH